jgi:surfeit locus 1 family protein
VDTSGVPNDHYEYAVTWFGLAAVWAVMSLP